MGPQYIALYWGILSANFFETYDCDYVRISLLVLMYALTVLFILLFIVRSDQGGSLNVFSDMQILIHLLMLLLFLMINNFLVHTKVQNINTTTKNKVITISLL